MENNVTQLRKGVNMGRPREYDEKTAEALLEAAERIVNEGDLEALSVRRVADEIGVTTRAVYSLFGSKDGLVVALGARAFDLLKASLDASPMTGEPASDLIAAGALIFRRFALGHPALFRIGVQRMSVAPELACQFLDAANHAMGSLHGRISRLADYNRLGARSVAEAACEFHALCEGLAAIELRGIVTPDAAERLWRSAIGALVAGWSAA
jgi:AcrR family transcriptional regulator